jgi:hypothetical protein
VSEVERAQIEKISERSSTGSVPMGEEAKALEGCVEGLMTYVRSERLIEGD